MNEAWISKKELLQRYGISYGALYRWKRMGLIPEAWFLRRSTHTGQETFFRTDQIVPRIELILSRGASLEALARELRGEPPQAEEKRAPVPELVVQDGRGLWRYPLPELVSLTLEQGTLSIDVMTLLKGELERGTT